MPMSEVWKDIPGFEGRYQVSDLGRVRSLPRVQMTKRGPRRYKGRILSPGRQRTGHLSLPLGKGTHGHLVHQLVMLAFVGECPAGMEVLHRNSVPYDNRLCNLHYGTRKENVLDMYKCGNGKNAIPSSLIPEVKRRLSAGQSLAEVAHDYGVASATIYRIRKGSSYLWV